MATGIVDLLSHGVVFTELWTNSSPQADYPTEGIAHNLDDAYDGFLAFFNSTNNAEGRLLSQIFMVTDYSNFDWGILFGTAPGSTTIRARYFAFAYNSFAWSQGYSGTSTSNASCIPYKLYGFKYVVDAGA